MHWKMPVFVLVLACLFVLGSSLAVGVASAEPEATLLVSGLAGAFGSTIGPGGALYVAEGAAGRISRVDPGTGAVTTYAEGLPPAQLHVGGPNDLVFIGDTAYVLVTMVGGDLPIPVIDPQIVGIYRIDGPTSHTVIADIGAWSIANPSQSDVIIPSGVHYAIETFHGGFLVTDGHHNRMLYVTLDGAVSELMAFDNIVPTGLDVSGNTIYMAEAGPSPHLPADGQIVTFEPGDTSANTLAAGAPLLVDVEFGRGRTLFALAQGDFPAGAGDGSPALPNTGSLVMANGDGSFSVITSGLNQPTSLELIGTTAYVMTFGGEIWTIDGVSGPPYGTAH